MNIFTWKSAFEIVVLWVMIYQVLLFFVGTRAIQVVRGIILLLVAFFLFQILDFEVLDWLLTKLFGISVIAILIIFHPEIRQGLARLGQRHVFSNALKEEELDNLVQQITKATEYLSKNRMGALIAIENNVPLSNYTESGEIIDSKPSSELMQAIFTPHNPLHDGALVIQHGRLMAAGCLFPLAHNPELSRIFGTRHRAALGLSEETDAVVVVVSEERGDVSLVHRGRLHKDLSSEEISRQLKDMLMIAGRKKGQI